MAFWFEEKETYVIGKRKKNCTNNMNVEFMSSPVPVTLSGYRLRTELQIDDWETYLKENPNNFKPDDTISLTKLRDGDRLFITQGQPYPRRSEGTGLADGGSSAALQVYNSQRSAQAGIEKTYSRQITEYQQRITQMEERIAQYQDRDIENTKTIIKLTADNKALKTELDILKQQYDDFKAKFGETFDKAQQAASLNDGISTAMAALSPLLQIGTQALSAWVGNKFNNGQNGSPQAQNGLPAPAPAQAQNSFSINQEETFA